MGCCQSDLKGEKQSGAGAEVEQPMRRVETNFTDIDYAAEPSQRRDTVYGPTDAVKQKPDPPSPSAAKQQDPINQGTVAPGSTQPETSTPGQTGFENKISDQSAPAQTNAANKAPYQDVTASPTSPTAVNQIDDKLPSTQAPPVVDKQGEKFSQ